VIQIEEPPTDQRACSTCMSPLTWIFVFHLNRTVAVVPVHDIDRWTFRLHTCPLTAERTWRHVQRVDPKTAKRGARRARAALAAAAGRPKPFTEEPK
jgi:hypothetical protein